jgi:hypothetical protein
VGKHASPGSSSHPIVVAALAQRSGAHGAHRQGRARGYESPLGWAGPAPASGTGGLGWPGDLTEAPADEEPAPQTVRRFPGVNPAG